MKSRILKSRILVCALFGAASAGPVAADSITTSAAASVISGGAPPRDLQTDTTPPAGTVSAAATGTNQFGAFFDGTANALVDASRWMSRGSLLLSGGASMTGSGQATGMSSIGIQDTLTYSDAALNGLPGSVTVRFLYEGSLSATNDGSQSGARALSNLLLDSIAAGRITPRFSAAATHDDLGNAIFNRCVLNNVVISSDYTDCLGIFSVVIPFTWGADFDLRLSFSGRADAVSSFVGTTRTSEYDFGHSFVWGGVSDVQAGGASVTNYSFASDSGFNWQQSFIATNDVPEPATLALLGLGLAALLQRIAAVRD